MGSLHTPDGRRLHLHQWPARGTPRGTVQLVHGLGEHLGRHAALAQRLAAEGWRVVGHDQRGHGLSDGARGALPHPSALLWDLGAVMDHLRREGPHILLGHSLGGLVAARFVAEGLRGTSARWLRDVDALVLSSPVLGITLGRWQRLRLALARRLLPNRSLANGIDPRTLSRDPEVVRRYLSDPLVHDRITPRLARFIVDAGGFVVERAPHWRMPTLLMWGEDDRTVDPAASAAFADRSRPAVVTTRPWVGLAHEIFNEPEREMVLQVLLHWLRRFAADPARTGVKR